MFTLDYTRCFQTSENSHPDGQADMIRPVALKHPCNLL